jgi:hypothetical protein
VAPRTKKPPLGLRSATALHTHDRPKVKDDSGLGWLIISYSSPQLPSVRRQPLPVALSKTASALHSASTVVETINFPAVRCWVMRCRPFRLPPISKS